MPNINIKTPEPYINQNLLSLIIGLLSLGLAEHYNLNALFWISLIFSIPLALSVLWTMCIVYPRRYAKSGLNTESRSESPRRTKISFFAFIVFFFFTISTGMVAAGISTIDKSSCWNYLIILVGALIAGVTGYFVISKKLN